MHHPYAPPASDVTPVPAQLRPRPWTILLAVSLLLLDNVLLIMTSAQEIASIIIVELSKEGLLPVLVLVAIMILLFASILWLTKCIWQGKNWARWTILLLDLLGCIALFYDFFEFEFQAPEVKQTDLLSIGLELVIFTLLFLAKSNQWFKNEATMK